MLRRLSRLGLRRGLLSNNRAWLTVGVVATALRVVRRVTKPSEKVLYSGELEPGQTLVIAHEREVAVDGAAVDNNKEE